MIKTTNKFSRLAIIFTVLYVLFGQLMLSNIADVFISGDWISTFIYKHLPVHHILLVPTYLYWLIIALYDGFILMAIVSGIIATTQVYETQRIVRWGLLILTAFNISILVISTGIAFFPQTFL